MKDLSTSRRKRRFMMMMAEDEEIYKLIDSQTAEYPDDLLGTHIMPQIKISGVPQEVATYIGVKLDYPSISKNELFKDYMLTIMVICENKALDTKTGDSRVDLIAERITQLFNWNDENGFRLDLVSDVEDPLNENYYYRRLLFKSVTSNSLVNGVNDFQ